MSILDTFSNPSMMHAAVVHLPIAVAMLGLPIAFVCALWAFKTQKRLPSIIVLICYLLLTGTAFVAEETGEDARDHVPSHISSEASDVLNDHESKAELVKVAALITAFFFLLTFLPGESFRNWMWIIGLTGSVLTVLLVAIAAHDGGALVYQFGVGTPYVNEAEATETPEEELVPIREIDMDTARLVDYEEDIWPMVEQYCIECHEDDEPDGDYDMTTIESMMLPGKKEGPGVIPGNPDESSIVSYIRGEKHPRMPKKEPPLSEDELHLFRSWIAAGALEVAAPVAAAPAPVEEVVVVAPPAEEMKETPAPAEEKPAEVKTDEAAFDPFAATGDTKEDAVEEATKEEKSEAAAFDPFG